MRTRNEFLSKFGVSLIYLLIIIFRSVELLFCFKELSSHCFHNILPGGLSKKTVKQLLKRFYSVSKRRDPTNSLTILLQILEKHSFTKWVSNLQIERSCFYNIEKCSLREERRKYGRTSPEELRITQTFRKKSTHTIQLINSAPSFWCSLLRSLAQFCFSYSAYQVCLWLQF